MVGVAKAPVVAVLARAPSAPGKHRLFAALGRPPDPTLLQALFLDTLDAVLSAGYPAIVGVEPAGAVDEVRAIVPLGVDVVPQAHGDLGHRMRALMTEAFARGAPAVVLVGSDLPDLPPRSIHDALAHLARRPDAVVLGPAADGGYYLIAACHVPDAFTGIEWGGPFVLTQTEAAVGLAGRACLRLGEHQDVDRPDDLRRVQSARTRAWVDTRLTPDRRG
jgi:rSAM/selenodomain-associated transferase 1